MPGQDCAQCGAKLADSATWCSLCYAPIAAALPVAAALPERAEIELDDDIDVFTSLPVQARPSLYPSRVLVADAPPDVEQAEQTADRAVGTWPCLGCGAANPMTESGCASCGLPFLAHAKTPPQLHVPGLGDLFQRPRSHQVMFIAASGFVLLGILLGLMALFGLIL